MKYAVLENTFVCLFIDAASRCPSGEEPDLPQVGVPSNPLLTRTPRGLEPALPRRDSR